MGYRIRLGKVNKKTAEKYRHKSFNTLYEYYKNRKDSMYYPEYHTQLYEIGKYVSYEEGRLPFYTKFDIKEKEESEFDILTKDGLKYIIKEYHKNIFEYYSKVLNKSEEDSRYAIDHIKYNLREWAKNYNLSPYYLDEKKTDGPIVSSWKMEYAIFNLVSIYRFFNWNKNHLIYSGW